MFKNEIPSQDDDLSQLSETWGMTNRLFSTVEDIYEE